MTRLETKDDLLLLAEAEEATRDEEEAQGRYGRRRYRKPAEAPQDDAEGPEPPDDE